jgi:uncharacterized protein
MSGEVGHFELPADNTERARKFYTSTFGWTMNHMPEMDYTMVETGAVDDQHMPKAPGYIGGGIGKRGGPLEHPVVTIIVDELSAAIKKVEKNGGKIVRAKEEIPGNMGWTAYFKDTEGNVVGLYQSPRRP